MTAAANEAYLRSLEEVFSRVYDMQLAEDRQLGIELLASSVPVLVKALREARGIPEPAAPIPIFEGRGRLPEGWKPETVEYLTGVKPKPGGNDGRQ